MIQRIQSLFLLLAAVSDFSLFEKYMAFAKWKTPDTPNAGPFMHDGLLNVYDNPFAIALALISGLASLAAVFLYRNRRVQASVAYWGATDTSLILMALIAYLTFTQVGQNVSEFTVGWVPLVATIIFNLLAVHFIKKDERLVRSADRLR